MVVHATLEDIDAIVEIVEDAKVYLKNKGIPQWQNGYPNRETFLEDLKEEDLYVLKKEGEVLGVFVLKDYEETYDVIEGKWLNDEKYYAIHRIAVKDNRKGQNLAGEMFDYAKSLGRDLRVDTHLLNESMQKCLMKNGFNYCGIITLKDKALRNAYQWRFER